MNLDRLKDFLPAKVLAGLLLALTALDCAGQSISDFFPKAGTTGDTFIITGLGFDPNIVVRMGGGVIASRTVNSSGQITVTVPPGASTGLFSLQNPAQAQVFSPSPYTIIGPGPFITAFDPKAGSVGELVFVEGVHFGPSPTPIVRFGGALSTDVSAAADGRSFTARVPVNATNGFISVQVGALGPSNSPSMFTVIGAGPFVTGFTPASGNVGTPVFIGGVHFSNVLEVRFNGVLDLTANAPSYQQINATVPAGATTGPITVRTTAGTNTTVTNFFLPPVIQSFSPTNGRPGTNVVIRGTSLTGITLVLFNGLNASYSINSPTQITATVPSGASTGPISIANPGFGAVTSSNYFVLPTIFGTSPGFGPPGTLVNITGENLLGSTAVKFGVVNAASVIATNTASIYATVPGTAVTAPISVTTTNGSATNGANFYIPARITNFTPSNGPPNTLVTITGENFLGASALTFAGTTASFDAPTNNTTLYARVPAGIVTGPLILTTPTGTTNSQKLFYGPPLVTGFTPASGLGGTNVTIFGTNFLNVTAVRFNGLASPSFVVTNIGLIGAIVPTNAATGPISVENNAGTGTSTTNFVLNYTADLGLTVSDSPDPVQLGSDLTYTVRLTNSGPFLAKNVRLTNTLPAGVNLVSAATTLPGSLLTGPVIVASPGDLAIGASGTITIIVTPQNGGTITNFTSVRSDYVDPSLTNNNIQTTTLVEPGALLSILREPPNVRLLWSTNLTNYALQFSTTLVVQNLWSNVQTAPVVLSNQNTVVEPATGSTRYFRLKR